MTMRIAVWHNLPSGGGKRALYEHVRGLIKRGHVVESWCPDSADQTYMPLSDMVEEHILPLEWKAAPRWRRLNAAVSSFHQVAAAMRTLECHGQRCADQMQ